MLARDQPPNNDGFNTMNLYSVHPFYLCIEPDGSAHGVFIFNSNPQATAGIPVDTFYCDTPDYMVDAESFTLNEGYADLPNYTNWLHAHNLHLTLNNNPYIAVDSDSFRRGLQQVGRHRTNSHSLDFAIKDQIKPKPSPKLKGPVK
uniref:Glycoside hydrolase family 31 TIM barrel domain-containing protein n=1 Tax=Acrobeloides nanus TaxID=290746 RepID=A0A914EKC4_9BILA